MSINAGDQTTKKNKKTGDEVQRNSTEFSEYNYKHT